MKFDLGFEWPKALRRVKAAAEAGTLESRTMYPVEVKGLIELVAGAPLDGTPREVAPGMTALRQQQIRERVGMSDATRVAYFFVCRLENGRVWQCSLYSDWCSVCAGVSAQLTLTPRNIVHAVTRAVQS